MNRAGSLHGSPLWEADMPSAPRPNKSATLKSVASEAGVSIAAASKVLHGRGKTIRVSEETAAGILAAAQRLNYVPNALARSMRMGKTRTIGLIFENFGRIAAGPLFYVEMFDGIAGELFPRGYRLTIFPEVDPTKPLACFMDGSVDGLIWCKMPEAPELTEQVKESPVPIVALNSRPPQSSDHVTYISCDNEGGTDLVAAHLAEIGHRRVLFAMETAEENTPDALSRLAGFQNACRRHRIPFSDEDVVVWDKAAAKVVDWAKSRPPHTAIFAWNEGFAAHVGRSLAMAGVRIPDDVSLVGFDSTQFCDTLIPPLTAVKQPIREMASYATRVLLEQVEGARHRRPDVVFPCSLDVRFSTGPRPDRNRALLAEAAAGGVL